MTTPTPAQDLASATGESVERLAQAAGQALDKAHQSVDKALHQVQSEAQDWAHGHPGPLDSTLARLKDLGSRGSALATEKARVAAEHTADRIRQDPLKAVLIAVATGAALAVVAGHFARRRQGGQ